MGDLQEITAERVVDTIERLPLQAAHIQHSVIAIDISLCAEPVDGELALRISEKLLQEIDRQYPLVRDRFVGISADGQKLPLRDLMLTGNLALEEIDNQSLFVFE